MQKAVNIGEAKEVIRVGKLSTEMYQRAYRDRIEKEWGNSI